MKTTELGLLLHVLPVRIIAFVETLGSHLKMGHWKISFAQRDKNLNNQVSKVQIPKIEPGEF